MKIKTFIKQYWILILILILGSLLRLIGLLQNPISLFSDEVDMGYQAFSLSKNGCDYSGFCHPLQIHSFSDVQPSLPIYSIVLFHFFGIPLDLAIRLSSAFFGILGILSTYLLVEKLASKKLFNLELPHLGLFSALIIALVPWHLTYSRIGFSLAMLYLFVTFGFYLFTVYLDRRKYIYLYLSFLFLSLTPMVYNTAKLGLLFYPFVILILPGAWNLFKKSLPFKLSLIALFIPLGLLFLDGNTAARFDYISIFTDPTASTEINYQRLLDSGPTAGVGTKPSTLTKLFHNKPLFYANNLLNNVFGLLSTNFLFTTGDPNLRHSPANWGMLYRIMAPLILLGFYFLIDRKQRRLLLILSGLITIALVTSAITRDGASHGSRSFMMLLPLVLISGVGLTYSYQISKLLGYLFVGLLFLESCFFLHSYWFHYRYDSATSWSYGMKEIVDSVKNNPDKPIVISPKNENPLIFYLYYTQFNPARFQKFVQSHSLYNSTNGKHNIDGNRVGDTSLYIGTLIDFHQKTEDMLPEAIYYLTKLETENSAIRSISSSTATINLPSGQPLYYEIRL